MIRVPAAQPGAPAAARRRATLLLIVTAILWSSSGVLVKVMTWQPLAILGARSLLALPVLLIFVGRPRWRWTRVQILGACSYVAMQLCFIMATKLTTAANAIFLQYASPVYVIVLAYFVLGERMQRVDGVAMAGVFSGMFLFFREDLGPGIPAGCRHTRGAGLLLSHHPKRRPPPHTPRDQLRRRSYVQLQTGS